MARTEPAAPPHTGKADVGYEEFARIHLRVARVIGAEFFKGKRNLIHLRVDLGYAQSDMIVGKGLPDRYAPEDMLGRTVVWMANLRPKKIVGGMSNGMIVAVGDDQVVGLVVVDGPAELGARVR